MYRENAQVSSIQTQQMGMMHDFKFLHGPFARLISREKLLYAHASSFIKQSKSLITIQSFLNHCENFAENENLKNRVFLAI